MRTFAARWRVSGFQIKGGEGFDLGGFGRMCANVGRDAGNGGRAKPD